MNEQLVKETLTAQKSLVDTLHWFSQRLENETGFYVNATPNTVYILGNTQSTTWNMEGVIEHNQLGEPMSDEELEEHKRIWKIWKEVYNGEN